MRQAPSWQDHPLGSPALPVGAPPAAMQLLHASALACTGSAGWALLKCTLPHPAGNPLRCLQLGCSAAMEP